VYGLDADLILLTLLNAKSPAYLVREASELGIVQLDSFGEEQLSYFSLEVLKKTLPPGIDLKTYGAAMSLLGNDFVPHSLTIKMREDGHARLLQSLKELSSAGLPLLEDKEGRLVFRHDTLLEVFRSWAAEEDCRMLATLKKKLQMRGRMEQTLETKPLEWMVEEGLVWKGQTGWTIHPKWTTVYNRDWLQCEGYADQTIICREYLTGLQWVLDYYLDQKPVDKRWSFPRLVPPLWSSLVRYLETQTYEEPVWTVSEPIQPQEQLAMVLPLESWHFLEDPVLRYLPTLLPQFWPVAFGFFSAGRIRLWECEALLPSLSVDRIRTAVTAVKESVECGTSK
jgi:5'-3' exonuclease